MENLEATKELYKLIESKSEMLTVDEVKQLLEKGVVKKGLQCCAGGLLFHSISYNCIPEVIELLVSYGVENEKTPVCEELYLIKHEQRIYIDKEYLMYATCKNEIINKYHMYTGSCKIIEQVINALCKQNNYEFPHDLSNIKTRPANNLDVHLARLKRYCEILKINYESLETEQLELPSNVTDWDSIPEWHWTDSN